MNNQNQMASSPEHLLNQLDVERTQNALMHRQLNSMRRRAVLDAVELLRGLAQTCTREVDVTEMRALLGVLNEELMALEVELDGVE